MLNGEPIAYLDHSLSLFQYSVVLQVKINFEFHIRCQLIAMIKTEI